MVKINLLPHREQRRKERQIAFYLLMIGFAIAGGVVVMGVGAYFSGRIENQQAVNEQLVGENRRLDVQIKEIATLKDEIESLKARQQAVEDLQGDRNQPVYLMSELVKQVPEGVYLGSFTQNGQRVELKGYAQSNERVSQLLRNISTSSPWLEKPDLIEITAIVLGTGRESKRVFSFTMNIGIKRPSAVSLQPSTDPNASAGVEPAPAVPMNGTVAGTAPFAAKPVTSGR